MMGLYIYIYISCRSQKPRGLRRGSAAASLLGFRVRIPPGGWLSVCCRCFVLSGRNLWVGLIIRLEESYRVWCSVFECDREASFMRRTWPIRGCCAMEIYTHTQFFFSTFGVIFSGIMAWKLVWL